MQGTNNNNGSKIVTATAIATHIVTNPSLPLSMVLFHSHFILPYGSGG
jgi:hypothetical protein